MYEQWEFINKVLFKPLLLFLSSNLHNETVYFKSHIHVVQLEPHTAFAFIVNLPTFYMEPLLSLRM